MIKLRNFEVENDFNLNKENYNFESISHCNDEVYVEPLNAIYTTYEPLLELKLTDYKDIFSSFICNGVELIKDEENGIQTYGESKSNPLYIDAGYERVVKESKLIEKEGITSDFVLTTAGPLYLYFDGNQLVDGEQSIFITDGENTAVFVCGTESFNNTFIWDEETKRYGFLYHMSFFDTIQTRALVLSIKAYGVNNVDGVVSSKEDIINTTLSYVSISNDEYQDITYSIGKYYELDCESCMSTFDFMVMNQTGKEVLPKFTFNKPIDGYYGVLIMTFNGNVISQIISPEDLTSMLLYEEGSEYSYYFIQQPTTYSATNGNVDIEQLKQSCFNFYLTKNSDGTILSEDDFLDYTLEYNMYNYIPSGSVFKCKFKIKEDSEILNSDYILFNGCEKMTYCNLTNIDLSKLKVSGLFRDCHSLKEIKFGKQTINQYYTTQMFENCYNLKNVDLYNLDISKVGSMISMFYNCNSLTIVDLSSWNMNNVQNMDQMFYSCSDLKSVIMKGGVSKLTSVTNMFGDISDVTNGKLYYDSDFDYSKIINVIPNWDVEKKYGDDTIEIVEIRWKAIPLKKK